MPPRAAWLEPLGRIDVVERLHAGAQFVVHAAHAQGQDLCVKLSAGPGDLSDPPWQSHGSGIATSLWGGTTERVQEHGREAMLASQLLVLEAEAIRRSRGEWNHEVACVGVWGGFCDERSWTAPPEPFQTALVTRRVRGAPLSSFSREDARAMFPAMLPALWTALVAAPHGDLSLSNLVMDRSVGKFSLIDPGVILQRQASGSEGGAGGWMSFDCVFTTNAHAYPIFPPTWNASRMPWDMHLQLFSRVASMPTGPTYRPGRVDELVPMFGMQAPEDDGVPRPRVPDQVALGILYDCLLADGHPVYGHGPATPLWSGSFGEHGVLPIARWVERGAPMTLARERGGRSVPAAAAALAQKLIRCEIASRAELEQLCAAVMK